MKEARGGKAEGHSYQWNQAKARAALGDPIKERTKNDESWIIKRESLVGDSFFLTFQAACDFWKVSASKNPDINHRNQSHVWGVCSLDSSHAEMQRQPKLQKPVGDHVGSSHLFPSRHALFTRFNGHVHRECERGKERVEKFSLLPAGDKRRALTDILYYIFLYSFLFSFCAKLPWSSSLSLFFSFSSLILSFTSRFPFICAAGSRLKRTGSH